MAEAEAVTKLPVKTETTPAQKVGGAQTWHPLRTLQREIDRLFEEIDGDFWRSRFRRSMFDIAPLWRREFNLAMPAVDIVEKDNA